MVVLRNSIQCCIMYRYNNYCNANGDGIPYYSKEWMDTIITSVGSLDTHLFSLVWREPNCAYKGSPGLHAGCGSCLICLFTTAFAKQTLNANRVNGGDFNYKNVSSKFKFKCQYINNNFRTINYRTNR